jgi:DNA invertase Pin-like site-specific DNA recombinase
MMSTPPRRPPPPPTAEKITPLHRERRAYVYVRQSSPEQVRHHRESQANQYALVARAQALGWIPERIHVIDVDLGESGQDPDRRGFRELVAEVSLGRVGLVLAYEASRLARSNAAWYELLDLATLVGTLIADAEGVYDPRQYNDRLLLGLRGMLSEAELHLLRLRLDAGRLRQVERGAFRQHLPTGLVRLPDGRVVKDPDQQVQRVLELVFDRFTTLGAVHRVLRSLHADHIRLPRRQTGGLRAGELVWQLPSASALRSLLHNPAYAGAFAYGRRQLVPQPGRGRLHPAPQPLEAWTALVPGVYPAYIAWETFMRNQERLSNNRSQFAQRAQGAPRLGTALLAGLAVCGRCGRQLYVRYKPAPQYTCVARRTSHALPACLHVNGSVVEPPVVAAFFEAPQPAELDVLEEALAALAADHGQRLQHHADAVRRAEYDAHLAGRQYDACDPDNRLVAAELERRWEVALRALAEAREAAARAGQETVVPRLDPALAQQLRDLGGSLPALWRSGRIPPEHQKALLRALIRRVVVTRWQPDRVELTIVWISGAVSHVTAQPRVGRSTDLGGYGQIVARVQALAAAGVADREIARRLLAEGYASARRTALPVRLVQTIRSERRFPSRWQQERGQVQVDGCWTVPGLAHALGTSRYWLYRQIDAGRISAHRQAQTSRYLIDHTPTLVETLRAALPPHRLA